MKDLKRIIICILITLIILTNISPISVCASEADVYLYSLKTDKNNITYGDTIDISLKCSIPCFQFNTITVTYTDPVSYQHHDIPLSYNRLNNSFEGNITADNTMNIGKWNVSCIKFDYYKYLYSSEYDLSSLSFTLKNNPYGDNAPPLLAVDSLEVNKAVAKPGDTVNISLEAFDDKSGIKSITLNYSIPFNNTNSNTINSITMKYNPKTKKYESNLVIDNNSPSGKWYVHTIEICDNANNHKTYRSDDDNICDYDFNSFSFEVKNDFIPPIIDNTPPTLDLNSLSIDKKEAVIGDTIHISFSASDDKSGIKSANLSFYSPLYSNDKLLVPAIYNPITKKYEASIKIDNNFGISPWNTCINLTDNLNNSAYYSPYGEEEASSKMSNLIFDVIEYDTGIHPLDGVTVLTDSNSISEKIIKGDLYISQDAFLTVTNNVLITGNIYVLGALKSYGGLSCYGTLYCNNMIIGNNDVLSNGQVILNGSNSISSSKMNNSPVTDIPLRIDTKPITNFDGKIDIKGATLNIGDMYIEDKKITRDYKGTFDVKDLYVGNKSKITVKFITNFGNTITKTININTVKEDINNDGLIDMTDISMLANNYNSTNKDKSWNSALDLNKDGIIDIYDIVLVCKKVK